LRWRRIRPKVHALSIAERKKAPASHRFRVTPLLAVCALHEVA
jgi:hypothetical protein